MGSAGPRLPTKFPCWCRAVYSWGGETEKDLGFVEGDLIECLNAGDGSWWMGRLRRDRRMMGLFPSNFVAVLEDDFVPVSRSVSPIPDMQRADSGKKSIAYLEKKKEKAKARRPFQGYKTAQTPTGTGAAAKPAQIATPIPKRSQQPACDEPNPPSTVLWQQRPVSRGPSRSPSPLPHHEIGSSPPPPPPPHRVGISRAPSPVPQHYGMNNRYQMITRTPSPGIVSLNGHTPPMIRDAMDGVMSSLDGMGLGNREIEPQEDEYEEIEEEQPPLNPWSPEAFEDLHLPGKRQVARPMTSIGISNSVNNFSEPRPSYSSRHNSPDRFADGPPHLETYVERMEKQLRARAEARQGYDGDERDSEPPEPPPKASNWETASSMARRLSMRRRKSAYDVPTLNRSYTNKTTTTNSTSSSSGVQSVATNNSNQSSRTSQSLMSGYSAGGFSATSAGSLARRNHFNAMKDPAHIRPTTSSGTRSERWNIEPDLDLRPRTPGGAPSYHSSHDSRAGAQSAVGWGDHDRPMSSGGLGGFVTPKPKKNGFWRKLTDGGKTAFASTRSTIVPTASVSDSRPSSPTKSLLNERITGIAGGVSLISPLKKERRGVMSTGKYGRDAASDMGLGGPGSWVMSRRDVNRSNTPGPSERQERVERCQMLNEPVICPVEELYDTIHGDEGIDGGPVYIPFQLSNPSFSLVDKAARFVTNLPSSITSASLATGHVCRPYRSDVQRMRAIFIWCAERVAWDEDVLDNYGRLAPVDTRRVIQSRRGSTREVAALVMEMSRAIGIHAEVVQGYLKLPGEELDLDAASPAKANHFWNAVLVDKEWRMVDASLASPTHPKRACYSSVSTSIAEAYYFLTPPSQLSWTHVPLAYEQQHMVPAVSPDTLLALPGTCPPFFRLSLGLHNYDTSILRLNGLEMTTLAITVPSDVEIVAEVETKSFLTDQDGDRYEDTDGLTKKRALSQPHWYQTQPTNPDSLQKRYIVKAVIPSDEGVGTLKIYAGKKGLMHSAREIVHPLAFAVPIYHSGENPPYEFVRRHPTPHATRQDLYVVQPQCFNLATGETYVFCVRQHGASVVSTPASEAGSFDFSNSGRPISPGLNPLNRPSSALSMVSSVTGSQVSDPSTATPAGVKVKDKPAKLAIQSPGGKIMRLSRKPEGLSQGVAARDIDGIAQGSVWEAVCKVTERGVWRGLVLADRSARWCVWGEWECS